jgi:hypothetical protein
VCGRAALIVNPRLPVGNKVTFSIRGRCLLFGLFWPLTIAESHTGAATVLVDEFHADIIEYFGFVLPKLLLSTNSGNNN